MSLPTCSGAEQLAQDKLYIGKAPPPVGRQKHDGQRMGRAARPMPAWALIVRCKPASLALACGRLPKVGEAVFAEKWAPA